MKMLFISCTKAMLLIILLMQKWNSADCYDPLDPTGNFTVTFDIHEWTLDGYMARVTIQNYYQYRHVEKQGWTLGWTWADNEIIWSIAGAIATQRGNCSDFKFRNPHSCNRDPVIVDLMPEALPENRTDNCCRGGLLAAWAIDQPKSFSSFEIVVGNLDINKTVYMPRNLTLMAPGLGYTCGPLVDVKPTVIPLVGGRRKEQVIRTWKSLCTYSTFVANKAPVCCVSLSTFYNPNVTPCPTCSCGCQSKDNTKPVCVGESEMKQLRGINPSGIAVGCTDHMCPVRVHWHVKSNYRDHLRVKVTVSNYRYAFNYTDWNLVVQHPSFSQSTLSYSFNSTILPTVGEMDEVALFWGREYYNMELLEAGETEPGSVTTEMLVRKDLEAFTLRNGWAFPRRVYFNGENCEMPMPDNFPGLPNASYNPRTTCHLLFFLFPLLLLFY